MKKVEQHSIISRELTELYERKNADYGDSFGKSYAEYGLAMPCIRLEDKLNRLKNLTLVILVTVAGFLLFALFYAAVYKATAGAYYRIVSGKKKDSV